MRRRRVLFIACLTAGTMAGAAAAPVATASALRQDVDELSSINARDSLLIGGVLGQGVGLATSLVALGIGSGRGRNVHALKAAGWTAALGMGGVGIPVWIFVAACASC